MRIRSDRGSKPEIHWIRTQYLALGAAERTRAVASIHIIDVPIDEKLLELALHHNLAVYDASYFSLAVKKGLSIATGDGKLQTAAQNTGLGIIQP